MDTPPPTPSEQPGAAPDEKATTEPKPDELFSLLDKLEREMRRVLFGVLRFFRDRLWLWLRDFVTRAVPYIKKFVLIALWAGCWLLITFGPFKLIGTWALIWMLIVLAATIWAYRHYRLPARRAVASLFGGRPKTEEPPSPPAPPPSATIEVKPAAMESTTPTEPAPQPAASATEPALHLAPTPDPELASE
jgi:hypothetical protein